MRRLPVTLCALTFALPCAAAGSFQHVEGQKIDFLVDGKVLLRYMYANDLADETTRHNTYKVYHHVLAPDGTSLMTKGPGGKYTHHRGIFMGWNKMGYGGKRFDTWHMKETRIVHQKILRQKGGKNSSTLSTLLHWVLGEDTVAVAETRSLTVHHTDEEAHLLLDFNTTLQAVNGAVDLKGDPEHAGFQYRPHNDVAVNKSAKYTFHREGVDPKKDLDLPWVALEYELNGATYTVQHMNHPQNPKASLYSAYRDYGRFGAFFQQQIAAGESLELKYRIRITLGKTPDRAILQRQYHAYLKEH